MDETYRMLGREHEADLEREALKWQRAAEARANARAGDRPQHRSLWQPVHWRAILKLRRRVSPNRVPPTEAGSTHVRS
jgi:hypothetical protein